MFFQAFALLRIAHTLARPGPIPTFEKPGEYTRLGRGLLGFSPKDRSPPGVGARGRAEAPDSRGRGGKREPERREPRRPARGHSQGELRATDRAGCAGPPGKSRARRQASAENAGVLGLLSGGVPAIWAAPTRHTRADRVGVPGKNRDDPGQKAGFPGRVPGPRGGKSRFPGGKTRFSR